MSAEAQGTRNSNPNALPPGTRLGEFELLRLLGVGGFGIVYLAFDHALEREVAVKEYMPASLAGRTETMHVSLRSQSDAETFALGLKSFVNEAKMLARFDHPSLLKVHRFWEANGTAYMAMPVLRGRTVKEVRASMGTAPDEAWMRALLDPLLGAIERLHSEAVYHRDIAPDNIQIDPDGHPVLLDFGAARRVLSDKSQTLTAILKPAYAPIEQYAEAGSVKQGPWTDLYALGATLHYVLMNRPPPPATARAIHDDASALTTEALPGCSENFLHIIDWMLAPRPTDRPQSVAALREVLEGRAATPVRRAARPVASDWERTVLLPPSTATAPPTTLPPTTRLGAGGEATQILPPAGRNEAATAAVIDTHEPTVQVPRAQPAATKPAVTQPLAESAAPARSKLVPISLGVGALVLAAVAALTLMRKPAPAAAEMVAASAPVAAASAALAATASVPESTVATVVLPGAAATPTAAGPVAASGAKPEAAASVVAKTATTNKPQTAKNQASSALSGSAAVVLAAPATPVEAKPKPEPAPAPLVVTASASAAEAPKPVALGPEASCAGRNLLSYFVCMEQQCLKPAQMGHADCKKWRANAPKQDQ